MWYSIPVLYKKFPCQFPSGQFSRLVVKLSCGKMAVVVELVKKGQVIFFGSGFFFQDLPDFIGHIPVSQFNICRQLILEFEIQPDHVHALVALRPSMSPSYALQIMKGYTSRMLYLLEEERLSSWYFSNGKQRSLWGDGKFMGSVGHITLEKAKEYLEKQEVHHAKANLRNPHPLGLGSIKFNKI